MLKVENLSVVGWEPAIRGMRNPLNSWDKMDSVFDERGELVILGPRDKGLMRALLRPGTSDHCKYRRFITVYCDVDGPIYWWKEADTYGVGTVKNSCSTMHTVMSEPFTEGMFSWERMDDAGEEYRECVLTYLNWCRNMYIAAKKANDTELMGEYWNSLIQALPMSWNQRRTFKLNYEVLANIYQARRDHKLQEWHQFCEYMASNCPYSWIFTYEGL